MKIIFNFRHVMAAVFRKIRLKKLREIKVVRKERERERNKRFLYFLLSHIC